MLLLRSILLFALLLVVVDAKKPRFTASEWKPAKATYYGNPDGSGTLEGACGYGEIPDHEKLFGVNTAALSTALFQKGGSCGTCYEIKCDNAPEGACKAGAAPLLVVATNECPDQGWCSPPKEHFDMSQPAFLQIAEKKAGVIPIQYRRVPCVKKGGIRFTITKGSNAYYLQVVIWNVAGAGDIENVMIKGSDGRPWSNMTRTNGQTWESHEHMEGQKITFRVFSSTGRKCTSWKVTPKDWKPGQTYEGKNFR